MDGNDQYRPLKLKQLATYNQNYPKLLIMKNLAKSKNSMAMGNALNLAMIALEIDICTYFKGYRRGQLYRETIRMNIQALRTLRAARLGVQA